MHPLHGALEQIGNLQFTIFGLGYASDPQLREVVHLMRQKQENYNGFKNRLFWFNKGEMYLTADQDIQNRHACLELLASLLIFYNAAHLQAIRKAMQAMGMPFTDEHFKRVWPTMTWHVDFLGDFLFAKREAFNVPLDAIPIRLKARDASKKNGAA